MAEVLVLGVAVVDFVFALDALPDTATKYKANDAEVVGGGCAANAAVAVARLDGTARLCARLGDDSMGDLIVADLKAEKVDTSLVQRTAGARSSFSSVLVDGEGERQIVNFRGSGLTEKTDWIAESPRAQAVLADTRWSAGAVRALELARDWGVPGVIDAEAPVDEAVLSYGSHVAFSREGLLSLTGGNDPKEALRAAEQDLPGWVCVTDGGNGTHYFDNGELANVPAFNVEVKDTLAAGDIWHGAFALALAEGQSNAQAIRFANAAAAFKCMTFGGRIGSPTRTELETFMKEKTI